MRGHTRKRALAVLLCLLLAFSLAGCGSRKLTTIRPGDIARFEVVRLADGSVGEQPEWDKASGMVLQFEARYRAAGRCGEGDAHLYSVKLYTWADRLELACYLNADGSVCVGGKRYEAGGDAGSAVVLADWEALFAQETTDEAQPGGSGLCTPELGPQALDLAKETLLFTLPAADAGAWSYYISETERAGVAYVLVWRETPKGDAQWLLRVAQTMGETALRHGIDYVQGSAEASGGARLWFMLRDAATFHESLWAVETDQGAAGSVLTGPCSNMVLVSSPTSETGEAGWIVNEASLTAVSLDSGDILASYDLSQMFPAGLFYGIGAFGTHKFVRLYEDEPGVLVVESIVAEPETSAPEQTERAQFRLATGTLAPV